VFGILNRGKIHTTGIYSDEQKHFKHFIHHVV
jgi:hypothetical protein